MEFSNLFKKLRYFSYPHTLCTLFSRTQQLPLSLKSIVSPYSILISKQLHTNPTSCRTDSLVSATGSPSIFSTPQSSSQSSQFLHFYRCSRDKCSILNIGLPKSQNYIGFRCFSDMSFDGSLSSTPLEMKRSQFQNLGINGFRPKATSNKVSEIIELIRSGGSSRNDLESKLNSMNARLTTAKVSEIFLVLNSERVPALDFFDWVRHSHPKYYRNCDICSLVIDNCGRLDDYDSMSCLLHDFNSKRISLTSKAFGFLPVLRSSKVSVMNSIRRIVEVLKKVGGSSYGSGVRALLEMLSVLDCFEMAKFVMDITERKLSYYNILIREKCHRCDFDGAKGLLAEMRLARCDPNSQTYNYIISSLCKNDRSAEACEVLKNMEERNCPPDALTFEIFIYDSCKLGKLDVAFEFLDRMESRGLEPRLSTHAAFIESYFNSKQYEEAYKYAVGLGAKHNFSSNAIYSMLAGLHQKQGNLVVAQNIISEMIHKGLRPKLNVYMRVLKHLQMSGREDLVRDLETRFSSLSSQ